MTDKEKIDEIGTHRPINFVSDSDLCVYRQGLMRGAYEMAEWKNEQYRDEKSELLGIVNMLLKMNETNQTIIEDLKALLE